MPLSHEDAQRIAREGTNPIAYWIAKLVMIPLFRTFFLMRVSGLDNIPRTGPVLIAPNHKSFWDAFFIAAVLNRRMFYMGKSELFQGRKGRLLLALGGFPVKRGESDAEAIETARAILERGDVLALFPEGTRVPDPEALGIPRRGAARIAIETGAPIIPTAITGTEKRKYPLPRRVQVAFGAPIPVADLEPTPENAARVIDQAVWPAIPPSTPCREVPPPRTTGRSRHVPASSPAGSRPSASVSRSTGGRRRTDQPPRSLTRRCAATLTW